MQQEKLKEQVAALEKELADSKNQQQLMERSAEARLQMETNILNQRNQATKVLLLIQSHS